MDKASPPLDLAALDIFRTVAAEGSVTGAAEGEVLRGYADRLLALAEEARQAVRPGQPTGRLRLGSMESTAASRLPAPLAQLHRQWPGVALELSTAPTRELLERLRAHALDAVLVARPPGQSPAPAPGASPPVAPGTVPGV